MKRTRNTEFKKASWNDMIKTCQVTQTSFFFSTRKVKCQVQCEGSICLGFTDFQKNPALSSAHAETNSTIYREIHLTWKAVGLFVRHRWSARVPLTWAVWSSPCVYCTVHLWTPSNTDYGPNALILPNMPQTTVSHVCSKTCYNHSTRAYTAHTHTCFSPRKPQETMLKYVLGV